MYHLLVKHNSLFIVLHRHPPVIHILASVIPVLFQERGEVSSHGSLKEWRGVAQPKVHYLWDVCSMARLDGCLVFVLFCYPYVVVAVSYVKFLRTAHSLEASPLLRVCRGWDYGPSPSRRSTFCNL